MTAADAYSETRKNILINQQKLIDYYKAAIGREIDRAISCGYYSCTVSFPWDNTATIVLREWILRLGYSLKQEAQDLAIINWGNKHDS